MATLIVVTSDSDVEGFVALARRFAGESAFPTLALYRGGRQRPVGEFDAIEGVSWLEHLDLEHGFKASLERLQIDRLVLQIGKNAYVDDQCDLLLHHVLRCTDLESILLDRGENASSTPPERGIIPVAVSDPVAALKLSKQVIADDGWTVAVAARGCNVEEQDCASQKLVDAMWESGLQTQSRATSALIATPSTSDAARELLTERDILILGDVSFEELRAYRMGCSESGDLPMAAGVAIAVVRMPRRRDRSEVRQHVRMIWKTVASRDRSPIRGQSPLSARGRTRRPESFTPLFAPLAMIMVALMIQSVLLLAAGAVLLASLSLMICRPRVLRGKSVSGRFARHD